MKPFPPSLLSALVLSTTRIGARHEKKISHILILSSELKNVEFSKIAFIPVGLEASVNALSTDVAGYLQSEYEKQIIASVERVQKEVST